MTIFRSSAAITAACALLASCNSLSSSQDNRICADLPGLEAPSSKSYEQMAVADNCIHRWGYRLAGSPGTNTEIADAVVGACRDSILHHGNLMFKEANSKDPDWDDEASMFRMLKPRYVDLAIFRVVQARAGKCDFK